MRAKLTDLPAYIAHAADEVIHRDADDAALVVVYNPEHATVRVADLDGEVVLVFYVKVADRAAALALAAKHA